MKLRVVIPTVLVGLVLSLFAAEAAFSTEVFRVDWNSSYDGEPTWGVIQVPDSYDPDVPTGVVLCFHGAGGNAWDGLHMFDQQANSHGWIAAAPNTHGENSNGAHSFAARAAQHDAMDLLDIVRESFNVDEERLYLTGGSMGGGLTSIMAEKYPHVFAAAVNFIGVANLKWSYWDWRSEDIRVECGGTPAEVPFEYERRSPVMMARNLRHVPFAMSYGRYDFIVQPKHGRALNDSIRAYGPRYYQGLHWFPNTHIVWPAHLRRAAEFFEATTRKPWPDDVLLKVDESQDYYYYDVVMRDPEAFTDISALVRPLINAWWAEVRNLESLTIRLAETNLDPNTNFTIKIRREEPADFVFTGLSAPDVVVYRNGVIYEDYEYADGTLTLHTSGSEPVTEDYAVHMVW